MIRRISSLALLCGLLSVQAEAQRVTYVFSDGNMPGTNTKILNKQDANSVAVSSLDSHQDYYWRVDCYDPDTPGPEIKTEGETWTFNTGDNCGLSYMLGDVSEDCYVNVADLAETVANWLKCNDVSNPQCQ